MGSPVKIEWISFLDPFVYDGGGELQHRALIQSGRRRGHDIRSRGFLGRRPQRGLRRLGLHAGMRVDFSADAFVLANIRNAPTFVPRIPDALIERVLDSNRAAIFEDAWVDVCRFDLPCMGDASRCVPDCDRSFARSLYSRARVGIFNSPRQREAIAAVIGVALPARTLFSRPAIDPDRFRPLGLVRDLDVLYVGTINAAKGYYELLERFGPDRLTLAGQNHLGEAVQGNYLGPMAYRDLPTLYNRARIFAHLPRWLEPMGRTPVEASLCGCEVIVNDRVGVVSYPREVWTDPEVVRTAPDRFWDDFERAYD
jgi:glycosyltransferase involved in cell wall biosynthesis